MFAKKNIFLGLICGFLVILTYFVARQDARALQKANNARTNLEDRRKLLTAYFQEMSRIQSQSSSSEAVTSAFSKSIAATESPNLSFAYFEKLARHLGPSFEYHFKADGERQTNLLKENQYTIEGSGSFSDIYDFLNALEKGRIYYRVRGFHVRGMDNLLDAASPEGRGKEIAFTLEISGYSMPGGDGEPASYTADAETQSSSCFLFSPPRALALEMRQNGESRGVSGSAASELPRLSRNATLVAISGNVAYVRDEQGNLISLREGDEVFEGKVGKVNIQEGFMEIIPSGGGEPLVLWVGPVEVGGK